MSHTPINKGQFTLETAERAQAFERRRGFGVEEDYAENRRLWSELPQSKTVSDYPLHVDLELSSICNLRCPMCYTITDDFKKQVNAKLMDFGLFKKLVDECANGGVYSIRLSFRGEAFLHPRIEEAVSYAKQQGIKEVSSLTNLERLDEDMFQRIMEAGIDWLTFSIDGMGEVYEQIRRPAKFDRVVEKLGNFMRLREQAGRQKPAMKVQSILPAIASNPQAFYDCFAPLCDMISANPLIDFMQSTEHLPKIPDFSCPQIYQRLSVGADGLCMMCANDEVGHVIAGDTNVESLHAIWHGEMMTQVRRLHAEHRAVAELIPCRLCYLPLQVFEESVDVGGRQVVAQKYVDGNQQLSEIATPERWKREGLNA